MKISKNKILSEIRKYLYEAPMDFDPTDPSRPNPEVTGDLRQGVPLKGAQLPATNRPDTNYQEVMASKRYREVLERLRRFTGLNTPVSGEISSLMPYADLMTRAFRYIENVETQHKPELEKLAIEIACKEHGLGLDGIEFEPHESGGTLGKTQELHFIANLVAGEIEIDDEGDDEENQEQEIEIAREVENLNLEKVKRRLINAIMQGVATKGHYMYLEDEITNKLQQITGDPNLINKYSILMSVNDTFYWQLSQEGQMGSAAKAGKEYTDRNTEPPTVYAEAKAFPVLIHELLKGTIEIVAYAGDVENPEDQSEIERSEDRLKKEIWDIRLGPIIWNAIVNKFPEDVMNEDELKQIKLYILYDLFKLPAREFIILLKELLGETERGSQLMSNLIDGVRRRLNQQEVEDIMDRMGDELDDAGEGLDDDDLKDFLGGLGISTQD